MIRLYNVCCFYDGSSVQYIFDFDPQEDDITFSRAVGADTRIIENGNIHLHTGTISNGVPAIQDTHFYYPLS